MYFGSYGNYEGNQKYWMQVPKKIYSWQTFLYGAMEEKLEKAKHAVSMMALGNWKVTKVTNVC